MRIPTIYSDSLMTFLAAPFVAPFPLLLNTTPAPLDAYWLTRFGIDLSENGNTVSVTVLDQGVAVDGRSSSTCDPFSQGLDGLVVRVPSSSSFSDESGRTTPAASLSSTPLNTSADEEDDVVSLLSSASLSMSMDDFDYDTSSALLMGSLATSSLPVSAAPKPSMSINAKEFVPPAQRTGTSLPPGLYGGVAATSTRPPRPPTSPRALPPNKAVVSTTVGLAATLSAPPSGPTVLASALRSKNKLQQHFGGGPARSNSSNNSNSNNAPSISHGPPIRQLPCKTWLSTGTCPYSSRCVFLHDPRVVASPVSYQCKRKSREDPTTDGLFWPTLTREAVCCQLDKRGQPSIHQEYVVPSPLERDLMQLVMLPPPAILSENFEKHQWAVYSTWNHFLDFLAVDEHSVVSSERVISALTFDSFVELNQHTQQPRLPVFAALSQLDEGTEEDYREPLEDYHCITPPCVPTSIW